MSLLLAVAILTAYGCDCDGSLSPSTCRSDSDCGAAEECLDGTCRARSEGDAGPGTDAGPFDAGPFDAGESDGGLFECAPMMLSFTGAPQAVETPPGARFLHIKAWAAGSNGDGMASGGQGGFTEVVYEVTGRPPLIAVVGRLGRNDGVEAFGFGARGGGGLTGVFLGPGMITASDSARALAIAGGGGSAIRDGLPSGRGGSGNHPTAGGMDTMAGGNATETGPMDSNVNTGGGGGYRGGRGRDSLDASGRGGTGFVAADLGGLRVYEIMGTPQSRIEFYDWASGAPAEPPRTDDPDYVVDPGSCAPGTTECSGRLVLRFLCDEPPVFLE